MMKNIGGDPHDTHYRYKREIIEVETLNKQGGLTRITNMENIRKQLKMPEDFVQAFYARIKKKGTAMTEPGVFRGQLTSNQLEKILDKMIKRFVLCPKCNLPEWTGENCRACGYLKSTPKIETHLTVSEMTETISLTEDQAEQEILYDKRDELISQGKDTTKIDKLLDMSWNIDDPKKLKKLVELE